MRETILVRSSQCQAQDLRHDSLNYQKTPAAPATTRAHAGQRLRG